VSATVKHQRGADIGAEGRTLCGVYWRIFDAASAAPPFGLLLAPTKDAVTCKSCRRIIDRVKKGKP